MQCSNSHASEYSLSLLCVLVSSSVKKESSSGSTPKNYKLSQLLTVSRVLLFLLVKTEPTASWFVSLLITQQSDFHPCYSTKPALAGATSQHPLAKSSKCYSIRIQSDLLETLCTVDVLPGTLYLWLNSMVLSWLSLTSLALSVSSQSPSLPGGP